MRFLDKYGLQRLWDRIKVVFQPKITATGVLKGNGSGSVTSATAGTDYQAPITNPVTGTGNSGYIAKFNGAHSVTNGPQITSNTTEFLRHDGSWQVPAGTYSHPTQTAAAAAAKKVGNDGLGHVVLGAALTASDVGAAASSHTHGGITNDGKAGGSKVAGTGDWLMIASGSDGAIAKSDLQFSTSTTGFLRQDGSWGVPSGKVTGVKGSAQSSYQTGNVNLTAANIGAAASNHSHAFSAITGTIANSQLPTWVEAHGFKGNLDLEYNDWLTIYLDNSEQSGLVYISRTGIELLDPTGSTIAQKSWQQLLS